MNRFDFVLWLRKYCIVLTAFVCIPIYFFTNQIEGYYIVSGLIVAWSVEQVFVLSKIDKVKEMEVKQ